MPLMRIGSYFYFTNSRGQIGMMLHTGSDTILTGCLAALIETSEKNISFLKNLWKNKFVIYLSFIFLFIQSIF